MVPARGGLRNRGKLTGRLSTSEHPHCIEKEGLGDRAVLPLDGRVNGVQVLAGGTIPVLEGFELFLCKKLNGRS